MTTVGAGRLLPASRRQVPAVRPPRPLLGREWCADKAREKRAGAGVTGSGSEREWASQNMFVITTSCSGSSGLSNENLPGPRLRASMNANAGCVAGCAVPRASKTTPGKDGRWSAGCAGADGQRVVPMPITRTGYDKLHHPSKQLEPGKRQGARG